MSRATSRLSVSPSLSPRPTQAFHARSRRSRRAENVRKGTISERDSVTTCAPSRQPAVARGLARGRAHERRQAVEVVVGQRQLEAGLVGQHVLREARRELREALHDLRVARLLVGAQLRAGAHEVDVQPFDEAQLLGQSRPELVTPRVHRVEPREQAGVHHHGAVVRGQRRGELALHGLDVGRRVRGRERVERGLDARQQAAAAVERGHGVVEVRRVGVRRDGVHFGALRLHRRLEGRREMATRGSGRTAAMRRASSSRREEDCDGGHRLARRPVWAPANLPVVMDRTHREGYGPRRPPHREEIDIPLMSRQAWWASCCSRR